MMSCSDMMIVVVVLVVLVVLVVVFARRVFSVEVSVYLNHVVFG